MNYQRLKKGLISLLLALVFAVPLTAVFEPTVAAQGRHRGWSKPKHQGRHLGWSKPKHQGRHLGWYKQQERDYLRRIRQMDRERQLRYRYQNNGRIVGYYDRFGRFRAYGYYDRFGRFHPY